jgi:hypothetical protein
MTPPDWSRPLPQLPGYDWRLVADRRPHDQRKNPTRVTGQGKSHDVDEEYQHKQRIGTPAQALSEITYSCGVISNYPLLNSRPDIVGPVFAGSD